MLTKMEGDDGPPYFMPPSMARHTEECTPPVPWRNDERLTDAQLDLFKAWVDAGNPEGDPETATAIGTVPSTDLAGTTEFAGEGAVVLAEGELEDVYACVPVDLGLSETGYITGLQVEPGDEDVVHHVVVFTDPTGAGPGMTTDGASYPCFGSASVPQNEVIFAWAPGAMPLELPEGSGIKVEANSGLVMQIHYHPTGEATQDQSKIRVRFADSPPEHLAWMEARGGIFEFHADSDGWDDPPFLIPADAANHQETFRYTVEGVSGDVRIWSVFSHMHYLGTDIKVSLIRDGEEVCLSHQPRWDFDWQRTYVYDGAFDDLLSFDNGDELVIRCTYNNTLAHPGTAKALEDAGLDAPVDIEVGEETLDEMCVGIIGVVRR